MSSSSTQLRPLELPELLAATLQYLPDRRDLRACILVNKLWASEATTFLWENPPPGEFACLAARGLAAPHPDHDRVQMYAKKIRTLDLNGDDAKNLYLFKTLQFPRLECISLDSSEYNREENILQFLQANLRTFECYGGPVGDTLLAELQIRSPHLERLLLDNPYQDLTAKGLLTFLTNTKSVKTLIVMYGMNHTISDQVVCHLAGRLLLDRLAFTKLVRTELAHRLVDSIPHPFQYLTTLHCKAESKGFALLTPHLLKLVTLEIELLDDQENILIEIAKCPSPMLVHLNVEYSGDYVPNTDEIIHLAEKHRNLLTLELKWPDEYAIVDHNIHYIADTSVDEAAINKIVHLLADLEKLSLWFPIPNNVSIMSLHNPTSKLLELKLHATIELPESLAGPNNPLLLPNLQELWIRDIIVASGSSSPTEKIVDTVLHHFPKLQEFEAVENEDLGDIVSSRLPLIY